MTEGWSLWGQMRVTKKKPPLDQSGCRPRESYYKRTLAGATAWRARRCGDPPPRRDSVGHQFFLTLFSYSMTLKNKNRTHFVRAGRKDGDTDEDGSQKKALHIAWCSRVF